MRAVVRMGKLGAFGQEGFDLFRLKFVARLYGGFAGNRRKCEIQKGFRLRFGLRVAEAVDQVASQVAGVHMLGHKWDAQHGQRGRAEVLNFKAQLFERFTMLKGQGVVGWVEFEHLRNQQTLSLYTAFPHLGSQFFVKNAFMKGVLIDQRDAIVRFHNKITVMDLHRFFAMPDWWMNGWRLGSLLNR